MSIKRTAAITAASIAWVGTFGLLGNAEAEAAAWTQPEIVYTATAMDTEYFTLSHCTPGQIGWLEPVYVAYDGSVYGDQDSNGVIDGDDCNWR